MNVHPKFSRRNLTLPEGGFVEKTLPEIDIFALENGESWKLEDCFSPPVR